MTAVEVYELTTQGGATDFHLITEVCESFGPYCLIGGLAVNCYVEPVYSLDVDIVVVADALPGLTAHLPAGSQLRIQFTTDARYQSFLSCSVVADVLGVNARVACREDVTQDKLWAYADPQRRLSTRIKDELDLFWLAEAYPDLMLLYPAELRERIERG